MEPITEVFAEYVQNYVAVYLGNAPSPYGCVVVSAFSIPNEERPHGIRKELDWLRSRQLVEHSHNIPEIWQHD